MFIFLAPKRERSIEEVPFSMAIRNEELMHECFPKHSRMETARMNKTKKQKERVRREAFVWNEVQWSQNISA